MVEQMAEQMAGKRERKIVASGFHAQMKPFDKSEKSRDFKLALQLLAKIGEIAAPPKKTLSSKISSKESAGRG
jgi:hypothetical protein